MFLHELNTSHRSAAYASHEQFKRKFATLFASTNISLNTNKRTLIAAFNYNSAKLMYICASDLHRFVIHTFTAIGHLDCGSTKSLWPGPDLTNRERFCESLWIDYLCVNYNLNDWPWNSNDLQWLVKALSQRPISYLQHSTLTQNKTPDMTHFMYIPIRRVHIDWGLCVFWLFQTSPYCGHAWRHHQPARRHVRSISDAEWRHYSSKHKYIRSCVTSRVQYGCCCNWWCCWTDCTETILNDRN